MGERGSKGAFNRIALLERGNAAPIDIQGAGKIGVCLRCLPRAAHPAKLFRAVGVEKTAQVAPGRSMAKKPARFKIIIKKGILKG
jgi:hypothetical protein